MSHDQPAQHSGSRWEPPAATDPTVTHSRVDTLARVIVSSGSRAPTVNAIIEAHAACQGLVRW